MTHGPLLLTHSYLEWVIVSNLPGLILVPHGILLQSWPWVVYSMVHVVLNERISELTFIFENKIKKVNAKDHVNSQEGSSPNQVTL